MKKLKRGMAFVLALCMIFSIFTNVSVTQAATKKNVAKTVTVKTQAELNKALKSGKATKIKIVTSKTVNLVIPKGTKTSGVQLVINAPKATIVNKATFEKISIIGKGTKSYTESGKNNVLVVSADSAKVTVSKSASVKTLTMDGAKATVTINSGSKVNKVVVSEDKSNITLKVNGKVDAVKVTGDASKLNISGKADKTPVTVTGKSAAVVASASVKLDVKSDAKITLKEGAEGTTVKASDDVVVKMDNKTEEKVTVTTPSGKTEVGAGETVKDVVAQDKNNEDKKTDETKKPDENKTPTGGSTGSSDSSNNSSSSNNSNTGNTQKPEEVIPSYEGYTLKWHDEFNGTTLNRNDWNVELHEPGWVNAELQEYVDSEENIQVKNGNLYLKPVKKSNGVVIKNLLTNSDFSNGLTGWSETIANWGGEFHANAASTCADQSVTYDITDPGDKDWHVQLKQVVPLTGGKTYRISYTIESTADRTIACGVQDPTNDAYTQYTKDEDKYRTLTANTPVDVSYDITPEADDEDAEFYFSMGKFENEETPASKIKISNVLFAELDENGKPVQTESFSYTSGRVNTQNKHDFKYGMFEVRAKVPTGKGYLPAFWMMPTDENLYGQWPRCGEIDCMEVMGQENTKLYGTVHYGNPHSESQGTYTLSSGNFTDEYHTFRTEWEPGCIKWYVDGILYHTENDWYSTTVGQGTVTYPAPFDQPFYMILNLAVGGSWVGYPDENTTFDDQAFIIDYVRAYQKDSYDENVKKPVKDVVLRDPDANGNYINNGDFAVAEALDDDTNWKFLTALEGEATASISDNTMVIATTNEGTVDYSVQLVQADVPLKKGATYTVSFKAKADAARNTNVAVKAPDRGYQAYMSETAELTTEYKPYTFEFKMTADSDPNGRLEYNMGAAGSTATIYIKDVAIKMTKDADPNEKEEKTALADGNYVYNGSFQEGEGRLGYWSVSEGMDASVTALEDGRRLKAVVKAASAVVSQDALGLVPGQYELSFDAQTDEAKSVTITVAGVSNTIQLTNEKKTYTQKMTVAADAPNKDIEIQFNGEGTYYLDNIRLVEDSLIKNGSFNAGTSGFDIYLYNTADASYVVDSQKEDNALDLTIKNTNDAEWKIQVKQSNVVLEEGQCYRLSFDIKSSIARSIQYAIQRDGSVHKTEAGAEDWTPYVQETKELTAYGADGAYTHIENCFKMAYGTDTGSIFNIALGGGDIKDQHRVCIDNIVLEKIDESEMPKEPEGTQTEYAPGVAKVEGNLLVGKVWSPNNEGGINFTTDETSCTCNLKCYGENQYWPALEMHGINLEKGKTYQLSMTINSTKSRNVNVVLQTGEPNYTNYGVGDVAELTANTEKEFSKIFTVDKATVTDGAIGLAIQLGKFGEDTCSNESIIFSNVTLKEVTE